MPQHSLKPVSDAERRLGELLESAPDVILELDKDGRIVLLNQMAEKLFGYTRGEMLGLTAEALLPEAFRNAHARHRARYHEPSGYSPDGLRSETGSVPKRWIALPRGDQPEFRESRGRTPRHCDRARRCRAQMEAQLHAIEEKYIRELELRNREAKQANQLERSFWGT